MSISTSTSETAIWARVIHPDRGDLPPEAAQFFLHLGFPQADLDRLHELTLRNQAGTLDADEADELRNFRQIGLQIDLLRSKARMTLAKNSAAI